MMFSAFFRTSVVMLLLVLAGAGCGPKWTKPGVAPADHAALLERDQGRCQAEVDRVYALPEEMAGTPYGPQSQDEVLFNQQLTRPGALKTYREDYDIREVRRKAFDKCMSDRGWVLGN